MTIKIEYQNKDLKKISSNLVIFVDEKFNIGNIKKFVSNDEFYYIADLIKVTNLKKKLIVFEISSKKKIILISIKKNLKTSDFENLGAEFYSCINQGKNTDYSINGDSIKANNQNFIGFFLHGMKLKSYQLTAFYLKK